MSAVLGIPQMTAHFHPEEFYCRCGRVECEAPRAVAPALLYGLEAMRVAYGHPIIVTSGLRCPLNNQAAGGVADSEHLSGEGADLACGPGGGERFAMVAAALAAGFRRIGIGGSFLHVGIGAPPAHVENVMWLYPQAH